MKAISFFKRLWNWLVEQYLKYRLLNRYYADPKLFLYTRSDKEVIFLRDVLVTGRKYYLSASINGMLQFPNELTNGVIHGIGYLTPSMGMPIIGDIIALKIVIDAGAFFEYYKILFIEFDELKDRDAMRTFNLYCLPV